MIDEYLRALLDEATKRVTDELAGLQEDIGHLAKIAAGIVETTQRHEASLERLTTLLEKLTQPQGGNGK